MDGTAHECSALSSQGFGHGSPVRRATRICSEHLRPVWSSRGGGFPAAVHSPVSARVPDTGVRPRRGWGGVLVGLWASSIVAFPDGIGGLRFSSWESALIGAAAAVVIFGLGCLGSPDICRVNLDVARRVQGWLFKDLSMSAAVEGHETNAQ